MSVLPDPWRQGDLVPLDGTLERNGFSPLLTAVLGLVVVFVLFQIVVSPLIMVGLLLAKGIPPDELVSALTDLVGEHAQSLLTANAAGQWLGILLPTLFFAGLHSSRRGRFLRARAPAGPLYTSVFVIVALLGLVALTPILQWLGTVNQQIPLPDAIRDFEQAQLELIEQVLTSGTGIPFNLFVLAFTPAICEELLFRGYVQRQAERALGIVGGIAFAGIVFGLYHLRLTQAVPLCLLGVYLAYVAWCTGSIWPAAAVHFANNALAVGVGAYVESRPDLDVSALEELEVPFVLVVVGLLLFALTAGSLFAIRRAALRHPIRRDLE